MKVSVKPLILSFLVLITLAGQPAVATELQEIRTGKYDEFTRLVFQLKDPARFEVDNGENHAKLSLILMDTVAALSEIPVDRFPAPIDAINLKKMGPNLAVSITLSSHNHRLKSFTLEGPARIVLDIYPVAASKSKVLLRPIVIAESINAQPGSDQAAAPDLQPDNTADSEQKDRQNLPAPAVAESATPEPEQMPTEPVKTAETERETISPEKQTAKQEPVQPITEEKITTAAPEKPAVKAGKFQQYMIAVLAGISIIILALVGFLLFQKKYSAAKPTSDQTREELKTTADIMASIDAKIKEKFKQYESSNQE